MFIYVWIRRDNTGKGEPRISFCAFRCSCRMALDLRMQDFVQYTARWWAVWNLELSKAENFTFLSLRWSVGFENNSIAIFLRQHFAASRKRRRKHLGVRTRSWNCLFLGWICVDVLLAETFLDSGTARSPVRQCHPLRERLQWFKTLRFVPWRWPPQ